MTTTPTFAAAAAISQLRSQRTIAQRLAADKAASDLLGELCVDLEEIIGEVRCAVMRLRPESSRLELAAAPNLSANLRRALASLEPGIAGCGAAITSRQTVISADLTADPRWQTLREAVLGDGLRACWSVPLRDSDVDDGRPPLGTLDFYFEAPRRADTATLAALEMAGEVAAAVVRGADSRELLRRQAHYDVLTGLPNRALFWARLCKLVQDKKIKPGRFVVAVIDVDQLKNINDTLGFHMGNHVLQALGKRLSEIVSDGDTVARGGGDEFMLLIHDLGPHEDMSTLAKKIREKVNAPYDFDGYDLFLTGSAGLSIYPWDGEDEQTLLRHAETALDYAKDRGGADFQIFRATMARSKPTFETWWRSTRLGSDLRHALTKRQFDVHYQLKYRTSTQTICGAEALLRWNHPSEGSVPPTQFIPMAERMGVLTEIGEWVLETSCSQNKKWQDSGLTKIPISVNVSAQQFRHGNLVEVIKATLDRTGLAPRYLELEITERLAMEDVGQNLARLEELKGLGVALSIDDFGTGFSSLSYLTKFPIDTLKIDRAFVVDLGGETENEAIVRAIISMAKSLSLEVVAEGVETEAQLNFLRDLGCEIVQGYYFSRPLPVEDVTKLLIKRS